MKYKYIVLGFIVCIAAFLRFYQLGVNPPSLTWDEAAWGYNAFSLLHTGRDEFGKVLPITYLESFGDFKPPVYAYLTVLPVLFFGLNEFSTRFASAFFGTLTVLLTYFLTISIFSRSDKRILYGLTTTFFLAISPWHINLSRAAFEANVATFFLVAGVTFFLFGVKQKPWMLILSSVSFVLSLYTFNTSRIVAPLLILLLLGSFYKILIAKKKMCLYAFIVGLLLISPLIPFLFSPQARLRFQEVNIFSDSGPVVTANQQLQENKNAWWSKILDNRRVFYARDYVKHYFDNLSPSFLFIAGDGNPKFSTQQVGQMYLFELPFLVVGAFFLFRKREGSWFLLPFWFFLGIIPAATARETPHALRIETVLPVPQILVAYGLIQVANWAISKSLFKKKIVSIGFGILVSSCLFINVLYYFHDYYTNYPKAYSGEWQYGYREALAFAKKNENQFDTVFFTENLGRPYIYYLFYNQVSPRNFRDNADIKRDSFGFVSVDRIGKYYFGSSPPPEVLKNRNSLYLVAPGEVPEGVEVIEAFPLLNGSGSLVAYIHK